MQIKYLNLLDYLVSPLSRLGIQEFKRKYHTELEFIEVLVYFGLLQKSELVVIEAKDQGVSRLTLNSSLSSRKCYLAPPTFPFP